jgi:hypothetical protein
MGSHSFGSSFWVFHPNYSDDLADPEYRPPQPNACPLQAIDAAPGPAMMHVVASCCRPMQGVALARFPVSID